MKICVWGRGIGKTTEVANLLKDNPNSICFVPTLEMRGRYPQEVRKQINSIRSNWKGINPKLVIIDEILEGHDHLYNYINNVLGIDYIYTTAVHGDFLKKVIYDYENEYHRRPQLKSGDAEKTLIYKVFQKEYLSKSDDMDIFEWEKFWDELRNSDIGVNPRETFVDYLNRRLRAFKNDRP